MKANIVRIIQTAGVFVMLTGSRAGVASPHPVMSLRSLATASDYILVGKGSIAQSVNSSYVLNLRVLRVLKGTPPASTTLEVAIPKTADCPKVASGEEVLAMWFVNKSSAGFSLSEEPYSQRCQPLLSEFEASEDGPPPAWAPGDGSIVAALGREFGWTALQKDGTGPLISSIYPEFVAESARSTKNQNLVQALGSSTSGNVRRLAELARLSDGDPGALDDLAQGRIQPAGIENAPSLFVGSYKVIVERVKPGEVDSHRSRAVAQITNSDPKTVRALISLLKGNNRAIQIAAAESLQRLHTSDAAAALAPFLGSPDEELRIRAVGTLACFANALPVLDPDAEYGGFDLNKPGEYKTADTASHFAVGTKAIRSREGELVTFWQSWVEDHPQALSKSS